MIEEGRKPKPLRIVPSNNNPEEPQFIVPTTFHHNPVFKGRQEELDRLHEILQNREIMRHGNASVVVSGISGSGKTHLVRQYVFDKKRDYPGGVFWVESMSSATVNLGLWSVAVALGLVDGTTLIEQDINNDSFVRLVMEWFRETAGWLLVLDGADHETDAEIDVLSEIIPNGNGGSIIITSVNKALAGSARLGSPEGMILSTLTTADCLEILFSYGNIKKPTTDDYRHGKELVELMGHLPLALHSAGSSMKVMHLDLVGYLREYRKQPRVESLTSFHIILDQLAKRYPEAFNLMNLLAFVSTKVPVRMLEWGQRYSDIPIYTRGVDSFGLNSSLGHLLTYSLIDRKSILEYDDSGKVDTIILHKVVQDVCRIRMKSDKSMSIKLWFQDAVTLFCASFEKMERRRLDRDFSVSDYRRFQVHIDKLMDHAKSLRIKHERLEDVSARINTAILRATPRYSSQSSEHGLVDYMPSRSQFSGSFSSLDDSQDQSSLEAFHGEVVIVPEGYTVESPVEQRVQYFPEVPHHNYQYDFLPQRPSPIPHHVHHSSSSMPPSPPTGHSTPVQRYTSPGHISSPVAVPAISAPGSRNVSPRMLTDHPYGIPPPPPLTVEYIEGFKKPGSSHGSPAQGVLPYPGEENYSPVQPTAPIQFPETPLPPDIYVPPSTGLGINWNHSDPSVNRPSGVGALIQGSRSQGDLALGRGRPLNASSSNLSRQVSRHDSREASPHRGRGSPVPHSQFGSRESSIPRGEHMRYTAISPSEMEAVNMARTRSDEVYQNPIRGKQTSVGMGRAPSHASDPMSRSVSTGSVPGGVALPGSQPMSRTASREPYSTSPPAMPLAFTQPMSRTASGSTSRDGTTQPPTGGSRYTRPSRYASLPVPTLTPGSPTEPSIPLKPEDRKGYADRLPSSGPGFHVEVPPHVTGIDAEGYDSGVDGLGGRFVPFGTTPPSDLVPPTMVGSPPEMESLNPVVNPAEYLAASRRASAPEAALLQPHHHQSHSQQHYHQSGQTSRSSPGSLSLASLAEAAAAAMMQRSTSEPQKSPYQPPPPTRMSQIVDMAAPMYDDGDADDEVVFPSRGGVGGRSLRRSRGQSPLRGGMRKWSPREQFLEYEDEKTGGGGSRRGSGAGVGF